MAVGTGWSSGIIGVRAPMEREREREIKRARERLEGQRRLETGETGATGTTGGLEHCELGVRASGAPERRRDGAQGYPWPAYPRLEAGGCRGVLIFSFLKSRGKPQLQSVLRALRSEVERGHSASLGRPSPCGSSQAPRAIRVPGLPAPAPSLLGAAPPRPGAPFLRLFPSSFLVVKQPEPE